MNRQVSNVKCNNCKKEFTVIDKIRKHEGGIEENYFSCPHCNHEYIFLVTDEALRREQKEIKKLHDKYIKKRNAALNRSEKLKAQLEADKAMQDALEIVDNVLDDWTNEI